MISLDFTLWIVIIEFVGALLIVGHVVFALFVLIQKHQIEQARLLIAEGAVMGLSFKLAGTLLKTIELFSWQQIAIFAVIFGLRTLLKNLFNWEKTKLTPPPPVPLRGQEQV